MEKEAKTIAKVNKKSQMRILIQMPQRKRRKARRTRKRRVVKDESLLSN
jgi:hypothetical protein